MWNKQKLALLKEIKQSRDKKAEKLIEKIFAIPEEIKIDVLKIYIEKCRSLYFISFL
jgi:hypothetical protein